MPESISPESLQELRRLRDAAFVRGETYLGVMLAGVDLYIGLGREWDLIGYMRGFAEHMKEAVDNTPTAEDLRRLYELRGPDTP